MKGQDFAQRVIDLVEMIPVGRVTTYGHIAKFLGTGGSARTVGYVLGHSIQGKNVPAHRVVNSAGLLTGKVAFGGDTMQIRLENEGVKIENDRVQDFKKILWNPLIELA